MAARDRKRPLVTARNRSELLGTARNLPATVQNPGTGLRSTSARESKGGKERLWGDTHTHTKCDAMCEAIVIVVNAKLQAKDKYKEQVQEQRTGTKIIVVKCRPHRRRSQCKIASKGQVQRTSTGAKERNKEQWTTITTKTKEQRTSTKNNATRITSKGQVQRTMRQR